MNKIQKAVLAEVARRYVAGEISKAELEAFIAKIAKPAKKA